MSIYDKKSSQRQVRGFIQTLQDIKEQISYSYFQRNYGRDELGQVTEFCKIMADVLTLPPETKIVIGKEQRYASSVQEIYESLDERHIEIVLENINRVSYKIQNPKTYIRTALYNSFFEIENISANETNVRMAEND